jgi:hypothetical protein
LAFRPSLNQQRCPTSEEGLKRTNGQRNALPVETMVGLYPTIES